MKLRTAPLEDIHNELGFVMQTDGSRSAKFVLWCFRRLYQFHRAALLFTLRRGWRQARFDYPPIGYEPFNVPPEELEREA